MWAEEDSLEPCAQAEQMDQAAPLHPDFQEWSHPWRLDPGLEWRYPETQMFGHLLWLLDLIVEGICPWAPQQRFSLGLVDVPVAAPRPG